MSNILGALLGPAMSKVSEVEEAAKKQAFFGALALGLGTIAGVGFLAGLTYWISTHAGWTVAIFSVAGVVGLAALVAWGFSHYSAPAAPDPIPDLSMLVGAGLSLAPLVLGNRKLLGLAGLGVLAAGAMRERSQNNAHKRKPALRPARRQPTPHLPFRQSTPISRHNGTVPLVH